MGDVAMTVPVIKNILQQNPAVEITVVSNAFLQPLFSGLDRCHFYPADLKGKHKGIAGMYRLYKELKALHSFAAIADLHSVLRSALLTGFFKLSGYSTAAIDKGRAGKKQLTRKENKQLQQLPTSFERYTAVFKKIVIDCSLKHDEAVYPKQTIPTAALPFFTGSNSIIGIAPFAFHQEKMFAIERMKLIVKKLSSQGNTVLLFGGGKEEAAILQSWQDEMQGTIYNVAGKFTFKDELAIISNLTQMISMDSANMHLASLYGVPVISIWGATHPFAGFYGWGQLEQNIVSVDLACRPCSVFGNKPCWRGDHACMVQITENMILDKVNKQFQFK
jgi:ADP-heptose:LPS heptosyltransferase